MCHMNFQDVWGSVAEPALGKGYISGRLGGHLLEGALLQALKNK